MFAFANSNVVCEQSRKMLSVTQGLQVFDFP